MAQETGVLDQWLILILSGLLVVTAIGFSTHILLNKRNPYAAAWWLTLIWFVPVIGMLLYWGFGVNRVARKARKRKKPKVAPGTPNKRDVPDDLLPLLHAGEHLCPWPLAPNNAIELLRDGDETYPAMLQAIEGAQKTIGMVTYIFDEDEAGLKFEKALMDAAARGVKVRLLVDGLGAIGIGPRLHRTLPKAGGKVASFWPRGRWLKHPGINLRNHRKILVVDGTIGFTGGLNISSKHVSRSKTIGPESNDLHFRLRGPVVSHLVEAFLDDWELATGEVLKGPNWFPELPHAGTIIARGFPSGPEFEEAPLHELLLSAVRTAKKRVDFMSPYFIPDAALLALMRTASRSGVKVRLVIPKKTDHPFMAWAARAYLPELVACGVDVWEVAGDFVHAKLAVVDNHWVMFGSANLDNRSFRLNFEFNVEAWSADLARRVMSYINHYQGRSTKVTRKTLRKEPVAIRLRNQAIKLFSPLL